MAKIPAYVSNARLDTGNVVQYPSGSPVGEAVQRFGAALSEIGEVALRRQEQDDNFNYVNAKHKLDLDLAGELEKSTESMPADGTGFHDGFVGQIDPETDEPVKPGAMDDLVKKHRESVPPSMQGKFDAHVPLLRKEYSTKAAKIENETRSNYQRVETEKLLTNFENSIAQIDPTDRKTFEAFRAQGEEAIRATGLAPDDKHARLAQWRIRASEAVARARGMRDPQGLKDGLAIQPKEATGSIVDRIIGAESGGNAIARNPNSSATGLGQFTSATWVNTIRAHEPALAVGLSRAQLLALRNDPAISKRMLGHLVSDNTKALNAAGVPVSDGSIYLAHFAGSHGAIQVMNAIKAGKGGASVESILGANVVAANPFLRGMSADGLAAWADKKMGGTDYVTAPGQDRADPMYQDIPLDRRLVLSNYADSQISQSFPKMKAEIQQVEQDALTSFQRTGGYEGTEPTPDLYAAAYGEDGQARFQAYETAKATAQTVNKFTSQSASDINSALTALDAAIPAGPGAAEAQKNFEIAQKAAAQVMEARKEPADYVVQNFPAVEEAWKAYNPAQPETAKAAISITTEMQKQIGIAPENIQPMPSATVDRAVSSFKDGKQPADARIQLLVGMVSQTSDPEQQRAIFRQMVKAGVPEGAEVVIDAYQRGDIGAARRMFEAAMLKPEDVPGKHLRDAGFDDALTEAMLGDGTTGQAFYALDYRDPASTAIANRDFELAKTAATLSIAGGKSQADAIDQALKDIQGDVVRVDDEFADGGGVLGVVPKETDVGGLKAGMSATMPQVMAAVEALKAKSMASLPADASPEARRLFEATHGFQSANLLTEGVFRPYGEGWGYYDPYSNAFLPGPDGKALVWTTEQFMVAGKSQSQPEVPEWQKRQFESGVQ